VTTSSEAARDPAGFLGNQRYLIDNSVFGRVAHPDVAPIWREGLKRQLFVTCSPFVLEALQSAESAEDVQGLREELTEGLPYVEPDNQTWELAFNAQQTMAAVSPGWHRASPVDFLLAVIAKREGLTVLHYDYDYDKIKADGGLGFAAKWIAPAESLEGAGQQPQVVRQLKRAIAHRLRAFRSHANEEQAHRDVVRALDEALREAQIPPLPPPPAS